MTTHIYPFSHSGLGRPCHPITVGDFTFHGLRAIEDHLGIAVSTLNTWKASGTLQGRVQALAYPALPGTEAFQSVQTAAEAMGRPLKPSLAAYRGGVLATYLGGEASAGAESRSVGRPGKEVVVAFQEDATYTFPSIAKLIAAAGVSRGTVYRRMLTGTTHELVSNLLDATATERTQRRVVGWDADYFDEYLARYGATRT